MPDPGSGPLCGGTDVGGNSRLTCTVAKQRVLVQPSFSVRPEPVGEVHGLSVGLPPARILAGIKQGNCPGGIWSG